VADGVLVLPALRSASAVPDPARCRSHARPGALGPAGEPDSQTPAAPGGGGYDAARKVKGPKRHIAVDTDGSLLMVNLTTADVQDAQGAEQIIKAVRQPWPWLEHPFADGAYDRGWLMGQADYRDFVVEIVRKPSDQKGFQPLPRRWVVERAFGWMTRRLVREYEERRDVPEAMIGAAMSSPMLQRIAHPEQFSNAH
jgi:putative transposase